MTTWRAYADKWETVHTSSAINDVMAAEECRAFAAGRYAEPGRAVAEREVPGKAGRWVVKVRVPKLVGERKSRHQAAELSEGHDGFTVVRAGSEEEGALVRKRLQLLRPE